MKNIEWCIKQNICFNNLCGGPTYLGEPQLQTIGYYSGIAFHELYRGKPLGDSIAESIIKWLDMEHEGEVLTSTEGLYLASLVKPFRDRVQFIKKTNDGCGRGYCLIVIRFPDPTDDIYLPRFRASDMYKGMKMYRNYKLEELGL